MIDRRGISFHIDLFYRVVDKGFESDHIILNFCDPVVDGPGQSIGTKLILDGEDGIRIGLDLDIGCVDPCIKSCRLIRKLCFGCKRRDLGVNVIYLLIESCRLICQLYLCGKVGGVDIDHIIVDAHTLSCRQLILLLGFKVRDLLDDGPIIISFFQTNSYHIIT